MKKYLRTLSIVSLVSGLLLQSCGPAESDQPLSPPEKAVMDQRLKGLWSFGEGEEQIYLHFIQKKDGMELILIEESENSRILAFEVFPTSAHGQEYLNLKYILSHEPERKLFATYIFARYEFSSDGRLSLYYLDDKPVRDAIEEKHLKGRTGQGDPDHNDWILTDSGENILEFIRQNGPKVWTQMGGQFTPLRPPANQT